MSQSSPLVRIAVVQPRPGSALPDLATVSSLDRLGREATLEVLHDAASCSDLVARETVDLVILEERIGEGNTHQVLAALRAGVAQAGEKSRWVRLLGARANRWLEDLDEVVDGRGDGAVSLRRGRLQGVEDTLVLPFGHLSQLGLSGGRDEKRIHRELLTRLKESG